MTRPGPSDLPSQGTATKADLADAVRHLGVSRRAAGGLVDAVLEEVKDALARGEDVKIPHFGKLVVRERDEREVPDPRTGDPLRLSRRKVVSFRPAPKLRDRLTAAHAGLEDRDE